MSARRLGAALLGAGALLALRSAPAAAYALGSLILAQPITVEPVR